jgi:hypothetical protein
MICVNVYRIDDSRREFTVMVPARHRFLGVAPLVGNTWLVFLVDTEATPVEIPWRIHRTHDAIEPQDAVHLEYVATIPDSGSGRHLFRYVETPKPIFS